MKVGVYLNTTTGGADYHKQIWVKAFAEGINSITPGLAEVLERHTISLDYDYSFCFSYQGEVFRPTNKMSLLRRALQEKHLEDGKIFFMDSDVLISYQKEHFTGHQSKREETEQGLRYVRVPFTHVHHPKAKHFYKDNWEQRWESIKTNKGITLTKTPETNPNYWFDNYQLYIYLCIFTNSFKYCNKIKKGIERWIS